MRRFLAPILLLPLLASCALVPPPGPETAGAGNTILGRAAVVLRDGRVETCAGDAAALVPQTRESEARLRAIYGRRRFVLAAAAPRLPRDPRMESMIVKTRCDAEGRFVFAGVPDGRYFVTAGITGPERGSVRAAVAVRGGETRRLDLTD